MYHNCINNLSFSENTCAFVYFKYLFVFLFFCCCFFCIKIIHHRWHLSSWQSCTKTCGKGSQSRSVVCQSKTNHTHYKIESDSHCNATTKPVGFRFCNEIKCPVYRAIHWSEVWNVKESVKQMCHYISNLLHLVNLSLYKTGCFDIFSAYVAFKLPVGHHVYFSSYSWMGDTWAFSLCAIELAMNSRSCP